jgi:hypothetical protein
VKISEFGKIIEEKLHIKFSNKLRFFSKEGVEIFKEEIGYVKNGESLYISKGKRN